MLELADAAARDDRDVYRPGDRAGERAIETIAASIAVHAREQDFARPALGSLLRPLDRIDAGRRATTGHVDFPLVGIVGALLGVDGDDDRLGAERLGCLRDERGILHGRRIHAHLIGACGDHATNVLDAAKAAADRVGQVQLGRRAARELDGRGTVVARRRDVEEDDLVGLLLVIALRELDRIARIAQVHEIHAFHDAPVGHVHARYHSFRQHA